MARRALWYCSGRDNWFGKETEVNTLALILELLDFVDDVVDDLGCQPGKPSYCLHKILKENGTGAKRQLASLQIKIRPALPMLLIILHHKR